MPIVSINGGKDELPAYRPKSKKKIKHNHKISLTLKLDSSKVRRIQSAHAMRRSKDRSLPKNKNKKSTQM